MEAPFSDYNNFLKLQITNKVTGIKPRYEPCDQAALFTDYIGREMKKLLAESAANARYFACLSDGSANNSSVMEQEIMYCVPVIKYVSIQFVENANAEGVKKKH